MIQLTENEKTWILLCKGKLVKKYPYTDYWHNTIKPLFIKIYGYNPDEDNNYHDYLNCMFNVLFDIYIKIQEDNNYNIIKEIFEASFYKKIFNDANLPIERAIHDLCGIIQNNKVLDENGNKRYTLI